MKVDEEGLKKVAERFLKRQEVRELGLSLDEAKQVLLEHAKRFAGCVNCVYSSPYHGKFSWPYHGKFSWTSRHCVLGLAQSTCNMYKPIIQKE